jgi:ubiquitin-activating enzyme E1
MYTKLSSMLSSLLFCLQYDVVVVTDANIPLADLISWNEAARTRFRINPDTGLNELHPVAFLAAGISGVTAYAFSDFGDSFHVSDPDGLPVRQVTIDHISNAVNGRVTIDGDRHLLADGDLLKFEEVQGMSDHFPLTKREGDHQKMFMHGHEIIDINSILQVKLTPKHDVFTIGNTSKLGTYQNGGIAIQVKQGRTFSFQSLAKQIVNPTFIPGHTEFHKVSWSKFFARQYCLTLLCSGVLFYCHVLFVMSLSGSFQPGRDAMLHLSRMAVWKFNELHGRFPTVHSEEDATELVTIAKEINAAQAHQPAHSALLVEKVDENVMRQVSLYHCVELPPLAAIFGGIVAQEALKAAGKYTQTQQWLYYDALELLRSEKPPVDSKPVGSRFDHQIALFGRSVVDSLQSRKVFLAGCGALGGEYLKLLTLMGLGIHKGSITLADFDRVSLHNLPSHSLFRREHIGCSKAKCAAHVLNQFHPEMGSCLRAVDVRVNPKSEEVFTDQLWDQLDFVVAAVDSIEARRYLDHKCIIHKKPLFEAGTMGTMAHSSVCLPHQTASYNEGTQAVEPTGLDINTDIVSVKPPGSGCICSELCVFNFLFAYCMSIAIPFAEYTQRFPFDRCAVSALSSANSWGRA